MNYSYDYFKFISKFRYDKEFIKEVYERNSDIIEPDIIINNDGSAEYNQDNIEYLNSILRIDGFVFFIIKNVNEDNTEIILG